MAEFDLSAFLAKFFGIYCLIIGVFLITKRELFEQMVNELYASQSMWFVTGIINLMLGLAVVLGHNIWEANFTSAVTIVGYLILIKGLVRMFSPQTSLNYIARMISGSGYWAITGITFLLGLYLAYSGFNAM